MASNHALAPGLATQPDCRSHDGRSQSGEISEHLSARQAAGERFRKFVKSILHDSLLPVVGSQ
jgi:hypothetical protein